MQAVIMAAGKSTRTYPLTVNKPKPLLKILNKTILEHNLDQLKGLVSEVIIIVGFEKDQIIKKYESSYHGLKLRYVEQKVQNGTGGAALTAQKYLNNRFIILGGDDLFSRKDIIKCLNHEYCVLAQEVEEPKKFGILDVKNGRLINIKEKPTKPKSNLANTALYVLDKKIFSYKIRNSKRGELEFTDMVNMMAKDEKINVELVRDYWLPIGYPWSLLEANVFFLKRMKNKIMGKIEKGVSIKGNLFVGKGTVIKSGSCIEGPVMIGENCEIGPFAHIRPDTIIGDNCRIGKMELYDTVVMDNVTSKHTSYAAHSVIGDNVNIGAGLVTADYRHDGKENRTIVNGKKVDTGRRKLGAFIGDNVKTGIGTLIYPGRKIWPGKTTMPGEVIKKDII
ncbi:MAG: bifunctional sugar-1-phosphate nucleotidylyltransferase/acetyltransferase [Candidatus Woesearchaeota archaeon]